jgi:hypothetical protein
MQHEKIIVRLSQKNNHQQTFDLVFRLEKHHFVEKWIERFKAVQQRQDPISEPWAFYNLNNRFSDDYIIEEMNRLADECNRISPGLFDKKLYDVNDQDTLNYLHSVFELHHGQLDAWKNNELFNIPEGNELRQNLSFINQMVHRAEGQGNNKQIRVVWFDIPKTKTYTKTDYQLFTNKQKFGGVYICYADVGKNLESLTFDDDHHVHDFVPNTHYSADLVIRFNPDETDANVETKESAYKNFFMQNREYFESKGYYREDPRLTTGNIKIAQLKTDLPNKKLLEKISEFDNIQSVYLI